MSGKATKIRTLDDVAKFDRGLIGRTFERAMQDVAADICERPTHEKPRKVTLTVTMEPELDADKRGLRSVLLSFDVKTAVPSQATPSYSVGVNKKGDIVAVASDLEDVDDETPSVKGGAH